MNEPLFTSTIKKIRIAPPAEGTTVLHLISLKLNLTLAQRITIGAIASEMIQDIPGEGDESPIAAPPSSRWSF